MFFFSKDLRIAVYHNSCWRISNFCNVIGRNKGVLNSVKRLRNGTRLICHSFQNRVFKTEIISGKHTGFHASIPCITLSFSNSNLQFTFKQCQFPV
ncbi:ATP-dependent DNA helicase pif1-like [Rhizophagus irregularis DAOM 181602=DAOM 197198]|nr:ATP-dependent DNA helicase pif1-like [Rhizophagus irregularis DAOM 181602=DAOM 197198]